ncbi:MAG: FkbM family methyltransferase [Bacteroidia bacterium]|nr:FkbM family methyltransferase [Bacteroidia bacterium]
MLVSGNPTSNLIRVLFWKGAKGFEYDELQVFKHLIKKSKIFFDIGSNIGYYAVAAKLFNPTVKVVAFEPLPAAYKYLKNNIALNNFNDVVCEKIALSDNVGTAQFYVSYNKKMSNIIDQLPGDSSLDSTVSGSSAFSPIDVTTNTLDNYVSNIFPKNGQIDFIKIDTEATEHLVFQKSTSVLQFHRPVIMCEIIKGKTELQLDAIFSKFNYAYYRLLSDGMLTETTRFIVEQAKEDYFIIPVEKKELINDYLIK